MGVSCFDAGVSVNRHDPTARIKRMPKRRRPDDDPNVPAAAELGKLMAQIRDREPEHYPLALTGLR